MYPTIPNFFNACMQCHTPMYVCHIPTFNSLIEGGISSKFYPVLSFSPASLHTFTGIDVGIYGVCRGKSAVVEYVRDIFQEYHSTLYIHRHEKST